MITETEQVPKKSPEQIANENAIKHFNKIAAKIDSPFCLGLSHGKHLHLYQMRKWCIFYDKVEISLVYYSKDREEFSFISDGIKEDVYYAIEQILEAVPEKWKVKIIET